ncbi:hypothetical protein L6452_38156 [Arctium lappa]|uniref:Uncharacterized protein n=1 Tax=Arctium lappa TaxID=4217 RepID=A0ACB8Y5N2_ARCLA|nr:hypothetical protein L6452_38156 [Arctium lappa]
MMENLVVFLVQLNWFVRRGVLSGCRRVWESDVAVGKGRVLRQRLEGSDRIMASLGLVDYLLLLWVASHFGDGRSNLWHFFVYVTLVYTTACRNFLHRNLVIGQAGSTPDGVQGAELTLPILVSSGFQWLFISILVTQVTGECSLSGTYEGQLVHQWHGSVDAMLINITQSWVPTDGFTH